MYKKPVELSISPLNVRSSTNTDFQNINKSGVSTATNKSQKIKMIKFDSKTAKNKDFIEYRDSLLLKVRRQRRDIK